MEERRKSLLPRGEKAGMRGKIKFFFNFLLQNRVRRKTWLPLKSTPAGHEGKGQIPQGPGGF